VGFGEYHFPNLNAALSPLARRAVRQKCLKVIL
jgi:hypothetical protein